VTTKIALSFKTLKEQRSDGWKRKIKEEVAKTREEVQREFEEAEREERRKAQERRQNSYGDYDRYERRDVGGGRRIGGGRGRRDRGRGQGSNYDDDEYVRGGRRDRDEGNKKANLRSTNTFNSLMDVDDDEEEEVEYEKRGGADQEKLNKASKEYFMASRKADTNEGLEKFFSKSSPDMKGASLEQVLEAFLTYFTDGWVPSVTLRAKFVPIVFNNFGGDMQVFGEVVSRIFLQRASDDSPTLVDGFAQILMSMHQEEDFRFGDFVTKCDSGNTGVDYSAADISAKLFEKLKEMAAEAGLSEIEKYAGGRAEFFTQEQDRILSSM
jgi:hypothetical protein